MLTIFVLKEKSMSANINTNAYLQLVLIVPAIALLGLTGCSTTDATVRRNYTGWARMNQGQQALFGYAA